MRLQQEDISFPTKRWDKRGQQSKEIGDPVLISEKPIPLETPKEKTTEEDYKDFTDILNDWMRRLPNWTSCDNASEIEKLKIQNSSTSEDILSLQAKMANLEQTIIEAQRKILEMQKEIESLKMQNLQKADDWKESRKNSKLIRGIFNLPKSERKSVDEILQDMDGCLKVYSDPQGDILEDIRSIRS